MHKDVHTADSQSNLDSFLFADCNKPMGDKAKTRKSPRLPIAFPVFVRGHDSQGKAFVEFATALNVSPEGMLVALRKLRATHFSLEIPTFLGQSVPHSPSTFEAEVKWTDAQDRFTLVGLQFSQPIPPTSPQAAAV